MLLSTPRRTKLLQQTAVAAAVKVGVDLVLVPVTVTDQRGYLVFGLREGQLQRF